MRVRAGASLLLVVVIVALATLAALFVRVLAVDVRTKGSQAAMKADLMNLRGFERTYRATHGRFTDVIDTSQFRWSSHVRLVSLRVTDDGWSAIIRHSGAPGVCTIDVSASNSGTPICQ